MKDMNQVLAFHENLYQERTEQEPQSGTYLSPEKEEILERVLEKIVNYNYPIDEVAMPDWADALKDLEEHQLIGGIRRLKDYTGEFLKPGQFRAMCKIDTPKACHKPYKAIPVLPMERDELKRRLAQMRSELA